MKVLQRKKFIPLRLYKGDTIDLKVTVVDKKGWGFFGSSKVIHESNVLVKVDKTTIFDEAIIFETEFEGRKSYGGMVV